jgi:MFS family permease
MPQSESLVFQRRMVLIVAFLGWMFDGLEMGMFPLIARPALLQMQSAAGPLSEGFVGHWMGIISALFLVGAALGGVVFGWLGDRIGRVRSMGLSILVYSLFTGAVFFSRTPLELGLLRFFAAIGMGGEWSLGVALVMEVWPENRRSILAGLIGAANNVGFLLMAVIGMSFSVTQESWRWVALVGAAPALVVFLIARYVPESQRWQAAAADHKIKPFTELAQSRLLGVTLVAALLAGIALFGSWGAVQWLPLWADQMAGPGIPKAKAYTEALGAVGAIVGALLGAAAGRAIGRRATYFLFCAASLGACQWLFHGVNHYGALFLMLAFVVGILTTSFYGWFPLYFPELFPTRVRATGQGIAFNAGRVFASLGTMQMGALMQGVNGGYARAGSIVTLIYAVGLVAIWAAPETKGRPLPA